MITAIANTHVCASLCALIETTKPRALVMIIVTTCLAYLIAATEPIAMIHLLNTAIGVAVAGGGSLALNQFMERDLDAVMVRTRDRPLPSGRLAPATVLAFGLLTMFGGYLYLWILVNPACSIATMACGFSYLYMYTPLKRRSSMSSFVGAIPGGLLPIMGWVAAREQLEIGAWILFVILFLWQIPHALIISMRHKRDYESVGMKQLPIITHHLTTKRQIVLNILIMVPVSMLPAFLNMTEWRYPLFAIICGGLLLVQTMVYVTKDTPNHARRMFIGLSIYLPLLLIAMCFDKPA